MSPTDPEITRVVAIEHAGEKIQIEVHVRLSQEEIDRMVAPQVTASVLSQLYSGINKNTSIAPFNMPMIGTCWACLGTGTNLIWYGNHVIHDSEECRALAASKPEVREHRG